MNRPFLRYGYNIAILALVVACLSAVTGCRAVLTTVAYLVKGTDVDAECNALEEKTVVVVCRPLAQLTFRNANAAADISAEVSKLLADRVPEIKIISQREVAKWLDEHGDWTDYEEVGKALKADLVVGVDLHAFRLYEAQTLYQGRSTVAVSVIDCTSTDEDLVVFERELPEIVYPPNVPMPSSEKTEQNFRREYIATLADQIARHFYSHDPHNDYAMDAKAYK